MSKRLRDFLLSGQRRVGRTETVQIVVEGEQMEATIKALSYEEYEDIRSQAFFLKRGREELNLGRFTLGVVIAGTVDPDWKDTRLLEQLGVVTPEEAVKAALLPGEIEALAQEILRLSGLNRSIEDLKDEAKK